MFAVKESPPLDGLIISHKWLWTQPSDAWIGTGALRDGRSATSSG